MQSAKAAWAVGLLLSGSTTAWAQEDPAALQVHGFVSQGYIKTTQHNYLGKTERDQGSFDFTEVGINFTQPLGDKFRVGLQVFAHDLGPLGNYAPQLDWYYLDYRAFDWLGFRAGKTKLPWGLYNESNDVDAGRVPILLPQSVYPVSSREFLFAQTGGELYGELPLGGAGSLEYRLYGGTIFINPQDASAQLREFEVPYEAGGRLMWQAPLEGLQLGASAQVARFDFDFTPTPEQVMQYDMADQLPADFDGTVRARLPFELWVASAEYQWHGLLVAAEYGRQYVTYETNLVLPQTEIVNQNGYLMASYQVMPWFTPGLYYSAMFPNIDAERPEGTDQSPPSSYQHDVALTLRYDITPHWLAKLEGHYMHGTAGLNPQLNGGTSRDELEENWGVFLLKTTGYF
ncbi:MAG TPA: hypothetical protein VJN18_34990 [Polyangiaceae bacterium]|nr:hypothetical protein [Polyangiaceae bacterium]